MRTLSIQSDFSRLAELAGWSQTKRPPQYTLQKAFQQKAKQKVEPEPEQKLHTRRRKIYTTVER